VKGCTVCQSVRNTPPHAPLIPWKWPTRPFQRVHIDFCQESKDYFLVVIDSHSKCIEVSRGVGTRVAQGESALSCDDEISMF
jgi:hypothetical protein